MFLETHNFIDICPAACEYIDLDSEVTLIGEGAERKAHVFLSCRHSGVCATVRDYLGLIIKDNRRRNGGKEEETKKQQML